MSNSKKNTYHHFCCSKIQWASHSARSTKINLFRQIVPPIRLTFSYKETGLQLPYVSTSMMASLTFLELWVKLIVCRVTISRIRIHHPSICLLQSKNNLKGHYVIETVIKIESCTFCELLNWRSYRATTSGFLRENTCDDEVKGTVVKTW